MNVDRGEAEFNTSPAALDIHSVHEVVDILYDIAYI